MAKKKKAASKVQKTVQTFENSGFYQNANIPQLQAQLAQYSTSQADAKAQAEAQYAPAFNMQKTAFQNQLAELGAQRDRDISQLNTQYNKSLNAVMAGLNKRNMGRSSLTSTKGVENENARNAAISDASFKYLQQQNEINANLQAAEAQYAQSVENRAAEIYQQNQSNYIQLMAQIAELQQGAYSAYANYQLQK